MKLSPLKRKGAIQLGVGTMVIIVIAVVILVLALVFVRRIFSGATSNVDQLNDAVKSQINGLFGSEGQRVALFLPGNQASLKKGETFGLAFGIKNTGSPGTITYTIASDDSNGCVTSPSTWLILRETDTFHNVGSDDIVYALATIRVPENENIGCLAGFSGRVDHTAFGSTYETFTFNVEVVSSGFGGFF